MLAFRSTRDSILELDLIQIELVEQSDPVQHYVPPGAHLSSPRYGIGSP